DGEVGAGHRRTEKAIDGISRRGGAVRKGWPEVCGGQHLSLARILSHIGKPEQHEPAGEIGEENALEEISIGAATGSTHREGVTPAAGAADLLGQQGAASLCDRRNIHSISKAEANADLAIISYLDAESITGIRVPDR